MRFNEHIEGDGPTVFAHACKIGLEGIVSKRKDSGYRSGRSPDWLKMKNVDAPAVRREAEEVGERAVTELIWRPDGDQLLLVAHHGPIPVDTLPLIRGTVAGRTVRARSHRAPNCTTTFAEPGTSAPCDSG